MGSDVSCGKFACGGATEVVIQSLKYGVFVNSETHCFPHGSGGHVSFALK